MSAFDNHTERAFSFNSMTGPQTINVLKPGEATGDVIGDAAIDALSQPLLDPWEPISKTGTLVDNIEREATKIVMSHGLVPPEPVVEGETSVMFDAALVNDPIVKALKTIDTTPVPMGGAEGLFSMKPPKLKAVEEAIISVIAPEPKPLLMTEFFANAAAADPIASAVAGVLHPPVVPSPECWDEQATDDWKWQHFGNGRNCKDGTEPLNPLPSPVFVTGMTTEPVEKTTFPGGLWNQKIENNDRTDYLGRPTGGFTVRTEPTTLSKAVWHTTPQGLLLKSIIYRFYSSAITVGITYAVTRSAPLSFVLGTVDLIKIATYWLFDKGWHSAVETINNPTTPTAWDHVQD